MPILHATDEEVGHLLRDGVVTVWRVLKPQLVLMPPDVLWDNPVYRWVHNGWTVLHEIEDFSRYCPLGQPGDTVTIKECWQVCDIGPWEGGSDVLEPLAKTGSTPPSPFYVLFYRADNEVWEGPWRSSAIMPQWAVRLRGKVEEVEVKRMGGIWHWSVTLRRIDD